MLPRLIMAACLQMDMSDGKMRFRIAGVQPQSLIHINKRLLGISRPKHRRAQLEVVSMRSRIVVSREWQRKPRTIRFLQQLQIPFENPDIGYLRVELMGAPRSIDQEQH